MRRDAELSCLCGEVRGRVADASPRTVTRLVCYCDDCQAYLHHLGRAELLDAHGGTDIVQVSPASLSFYQGGERICGLRFTPKGLYRWYATCCRTPLGNTLKPSVPFVGIVASAFDVNAGGPDAFFSKPIGSILGKFAVGTAPEGSTRLDPRFLVRALGSVLGWKVRGKTWPHPFFDRVTGAPSHPLTVLSSAERDALRPFTGPHPTARVRA